MAQRKVDGSSCNRGKRRVEFGVRDAVLYKERVLSKSARGVSAELVRKYVGPFTIKEILSAAVYLLEDVGRHDAETHIVELKW